MCGRLHHQSQEPSSIEMLLKERALTFGMLVAEGLRPHVAQSDCSLAAAVDEQMAFRRMELGRRYHFRQLLHVGGFDVDNVWKKSSSRKPFLNVSNKRPARVYNISVHLSG